MTIVLPEDPTLDEVRAYLAPHLAAQAAFDGWNETAVLAAAEVAGVDADLARLSFNAGPVDMIDAWFAAVDRQMAAKYSAEELGEMKIRQRIKALVEARLEALEADREGLRRALAILAAPPWHLARALGASSTTTFARVSAVRSRDQRLPGMAPSSGSRMPDTSPPASLCQGGRLSSACGRKRSDD